MKKLITCLSLSLGMALLTAGSSVLASVPLQPVDPDTEQVTLDSLGLDEQLWGRPDQPGDRQALLTSIENSLRYLSTPSAAKAYQQYPVSGIRLDRVRRSLVRFRQLLLSSTSPAELQAAVKREFLLYKSVGRDDQGTVLFTGYFEPVYAASRTPSAEYRYPLYRLPSNFQGWTMPHPTRADLEGDDGLGNNSLMGGLELVWLRDRLQAFLVHIQGSAQLQFADGSLMTVGYAGKTNYPYTSIGRELVKDRKLPLDGLTLPVLIDYFTQFPTELDQYLPRNESFVFFRETNGAPATGSIGVPVTAERSIATDKSLMPPGALALINTSIPYPTANGQLESRLVSRYVLDQDTGSAIKGPGRVDIFMGTGSLAGDRAGVIGGTGELYYLLLKD
ncbi:MULTISPECIES: murein transglycosylase A [unclassified Coleofasciculus]|uniref:murein transglycosylase A n=1 Tax=unclassified Coleofasciculus TaxID=2692782 RepID=UPI00187E83C1|nr:MULTISPECIES: murein transglycosylase A [unclassified Coleofasciculus]MBE9125126.1 murein transglycosylase A [Coleofasciculus sp. LEGE 07081]MBE9148343.1 murein transglycosylase A [Coleofasciculus sp. LEGE 07092]